MTTVFGFGAIGLLGIVGAVFAGRWRRVPKATEVFIPEVVSMWPVPVGSGLPRYPSADGAYRVFADDETGCWYGCDTAERLWSPWKYSLAGTELQAREWCEERAAQAVLVIDADR